MLSGLLLARLRNMKYVGSYKGYMLYLRTNKDKVSNMQQFARIKLTKLYQLQVEVHRHPKFEWVSIALVLLFRLEKLFNWNWNERIRRYAAEANAYQHSGKAAWWKRIAPPGPGCSSNRTSPSVLCCSVKCKSRLGNWNLIVFSFSAILSISSACNGCWLN